MPRNSHHISKPPSKSRNPDSESASAPDQESAPLFFYMPDAAYGEFCQWYACTFTVPNAEISSLVGHTVNANDPNGSTTFNCAEQFMMYCKAARFSDVERQVQVLTSTSPKEQKRLGKSTIGFNDSSWDQIKSQVVEAGNMHKFGQNESLKRKLLSTGHRMLCEAASKDRVWGIGYNANRAMNFRKHWGENRLGRALMSVRDRLRAEETKAAEPWNHWEES